jgi:6-phosphogluconolactonase (cycloisomerase 2 family)
MNRKYYKTIDIQTLEGRTLMSSGGYLSGTFVYLETNDPNKGQNAVLAYRENPATGALTAAGKFLTYGTGHLNAGSKLGPDDSDKEVIASPDGKYLYAVNQGSNNIAVFAIHPNGALSIVYGAPVYSGGAEPVSLAITDGRLYVLNRGNGYEGKPATIAPNVAAFTVGQHGRLLPIPKSTVTLPVNLSPAQVLASAGGKFLFVDNFATPSNLKVSLADTIEPFVINANGTLTAVKNGAAGLPSNPPLVLGLVQDPVHHIIYSGRAPTGGISVFTYDDAGKLSFDDSVESKGAGTCWLTISPNGKYLYGTDSGSDQISVYSLADPLKPVFIQEFQLNGPINPGGTASEGVKTNDFQLSFDPSGKFLWVVSHTIDTAFQHGNQLHTLHVSADGKLTEASASPQFFPAADAPATAHPQGLAVVTPAGYYAGYTGLFSDGQDPIA